MYVTSDKNALPTTMTANYTELLDEAVRAEQATLRDVAARLYEKCLTSVDGAAHGSSRACDILRDLRTPRAQHDD